MSERLSLVSYLEFSRDTSKELIELTETQLPNAKANDDESRKLELISEASKNRRDLSEAYKYIHEEVLESGMGPERSLPLWMYAVGAPEEAVHNANRIFASETVKDRGSVAVSGFFNGSQVVDTFLDKVDVAAAFVTYSPILIIRNEVGEEITEGHDTSMLAIPITHDFRVYDNLYPVGAKDSIDLMVGSLVMRHAD